MSARCIDCGVRLLAGRKLKKCQPCHNVQVKAWRENMGPPLAATKRFPGVDIDRIHRKTGAGR